MAVPSPDEARATVLEAARPGPPEARALLAAGGRALAEAVHAGRDLPAFPQSAMDGYALAAAEGAPAGARFRLAGTSRAGGPGAPLAPGEAARIFTGAQVPEGATCVAPQEVVRTDGAQVEVCEAVPAGRHVRHAGSDVAAGQEALAAGTRLGPAALALLRALGVEFVNVHRAPRVALVLSGDELCEDAAALRPGQVLEANSGGLRQALREEGVELGSQRLARDTEEAHVRALGAALEESELLLVTGGISVGDFDLVRPALERLGVETVFWRVAQRPGGPLYFGRRGAQLVFGLPGNPASTLVCWYEYVLPAVRRCLGLAEVRLPRVPARLGAGYRKRAEMEYFVRARLHRDGAELVVTPHAQQESHALRSFALAHALAVFPAGRERFGPGDTVDCDVLPGAGRLA